MLDIGLSELLLLGAVALIVLGPEKLPHAARMAGAWYGRIRRTLANVQAEIANEVHLSEMRQKIKDEFSDMNTLKDGLANDLRDFEHSIYPTDLSDAERPPFAQTDWSHGIKAPITSSARGYYFFFVPTSMFLSLIPPAPYLSKNEFRKHKISIVKPQDTEKSIDTEQIIDVTSR